MAWVSHPERGRVEVSAMESYEEFCRRSLATLQRDAFTERPCEPPWSPESRSVISFRGRAALSPLLSAEQRSEMCEHRRRAVQLEGKRQRNNLLAQVEDISGQAQANKAPSEAVEKLPVSKSATASGFTLVTDSPGLPRDPVFGLDQPAGPSSETPILSVRKAVEGVTAESEEKSEEEEEDDISLDSLLKQSRGYEKRGQSQQGSRVVHTVTKTPQTETPCDKERRTSSPMRDTGVEFGFSLHHSPVGPPQTQIQHQTLYDPNPQPSRCLSPSLPDQYARLPRPEAGVSPCPPRRRPRPVSTGNINISFPIGPADLIPRNPGTSGESPGMADKGDASSVVTTSPENWSTAGGEVEVVRGGSRRSSHCGTGPLQETCSPVSASGCSPMGHHDHLAAGFRRRCHTLDSQPHGSHSGFDNIDRSQERVPRLMVGVTRMAPTRRSPAAPINRSREVDSPSPSLQRPRVTSDVDQVTLRTEPEDTQRTNNGRITSAAIRNAAEAQASKTEENQRRVQGLEDMKRLLKEEHALQMSLLLAEQKREQQYVRLELEETERKLREQGCVQPLSGDAIGWTCVSASDRRPVVSPSCPGLSLAHTPSEPSPGHSFPRPVSSIVPSPSVQPPVYLCGPTWVVSKPRARLSLVLTTEQQRAFCKIGAIIRGFLTRRLLKTEKVKHLRKTVVDTQEFIHTFQSEATQKRGTFSAQDCFLKERVGAQLRAALYDIHNIFFEMPLGARLALLQQERELHAERQLRDMEKPKSPKERLVLSAATQRSLDRKKKVSESQAQARKMPQKPKSSTTNRSQTPQSLKPNQGQNSPRLNCQGSWHRRAPEERVRRSDSLKKQHSLG